jgi:hypothetical protein
MQERAASRMSRGAPFHRPGQPTLTRVPSRMLACGFAITLVDSIHEQA